MKVLVAKEFEAGRWAKVAVFGGTASGQIRGIPVKHQGQMASHVAKSAMRQFADEKASCDVFFKFGLSRYRATRIG